MGNQKKVKVQCGLCGSKEYTWCNHGRQLHVICVGCSIGGPLASDKESAIKAFQEEAREIAEEKNGILVDIVSSMGMPVKGSDLFMDLTSRFGRMLSEAARVSADKGDRLVLAQFAQELSASALRYAVMMKTEHGTNP